MRVHHSVIPVRHNVYDSVGFILSTVAQLELITITTVVYSTISVVYSIMRMGLPLTIR